MERSNFRFTLDIRDSSGGCQLDMKRGDTHRRLCITLADGGCPYVITETCFPVLMAKTEDGRLLYTNCTVENGGKGYYKRYYRGYAKSYENNDRSVVSADEKNTEK